MISFTQGDHSPDTVKFPVNAGAVLSMLIGTHIMPVLVSSLPIKIGHNDFIMIKAVVELTN